MDWFVNLTMTRMSVCRQIGLDYETKQLYTPGLMKHQRKGKMVGKQVVGMMVICVTFESAKVGFDSFKE